MTEYTFKLTAQEVDMVAGALGKGPYETVAGLIIKLQAQYNEQVKPIPIVETDDAN